MSRWTAALVGIVSLVAALAAGHLVAALVGPAASPFLAVGNAVIDLTPTPLKDFAVRAFGTYDKLVLLIAIALVIAALAVVAGLLSRKTPTPGTVLAGVLGAVGVAAVLYRPDLGQLAILAPLAAGAVGIGVFRWLHGEAQPERHVESRRNLLIVAGASAFAGLGGQVLGTRTDVEGSRAAVGELKAAKKAPAIPAGADFVQDGTPSFITPNRDFYRIDTALSVPRLRAEDWTLRVHGLVDRELTLHYADLRRRDLVERAITMTCVSNEVGGPYVSTATFIGVPLHEVLDEAGIRPDADQLFSTSADGWTAGTPVDVVRDPARGALIALGMNGEPLPVEHGFPARLVVPGLYGYVSATKWVVDLELTTFAAKRAYWLDRGWAERAPIKTMSRIDAPKGRSTTGRRVTVAGVAWAQPTGIAKVEVRVDGGPWQVAELSADVDDATWRMWRLPLDLEPGRHTVESRATDKSGSTQPQARVAPVPDGATGWHSISFTVG